MEKESFLSEIEIDNDINIDSSDSLKFSKDRDANSASKPKTSKSANPLYQSFLRLKQGILSRADRSIAGCVDEPIAQFVSAINSEAVYCTTSSCSGRIVIVQVNIVAFIF